MRFRLFILFLLIIPWIAVLGQEYKATARIDSTSVLIGDHFRLDLDVSIPASAKATWPVFGDTILKNLIILKRTGIDTSFLDDKKTIHLHQQFLLTCFDSGFYTLPSLRVPYILPPDTTQYAVQTKMVFLNVRSIKVDTTQAIKPIKGPRKVPLSFRELLPWILIALLASGAVIAGIFFYRRRKKHGTVFTISPGIQLKPHEIALAELEKLRSKKLWQEGRIKEYHSELTDIIRKYIESRFRVNALECTTGEIYASLSDLGELSDELSGKLLQMLLLADLVKFAKERPLPDENEHSMNLAVAFVNGTSMPERIPVPQDGRHDAGMEQVDGSVVNTGTKQ